MGNRMKNRRKEIGRGLRPSLLPAPEQECPAPGQLMMPQIPLPEQEVGWPVMPPQFPPGMKGLS